MTLPSDPVARFAEIGAEIAERVERVLSGWVAAQVTSVAEAWGRLDPKTRSGLDASVVAVGPVVAVRIAAELRTMAALPVADQVVTPLQIVRGATADVTALLEGVGIPPIERDAFEERAFPADRYGATPASLADLGDPDLGPLQLAWGLAKVQVLRQG